MNKKKPQPADGRTIAAQILTRWLKTAVFPDHPLQDVTVDRAFVMEAVLGVVRQYRALDWIRTQFVPNKPQPDLEACLLLGIYQLCFMDNAVDYATVHETVETTKKISTQKSANLVSRLQMS